MRDLDLEQYDYALPRELIAQAPPRQRAGGRLLVLYRKAGAIEHHRIRDLPHLIPAQALMLINDSRVIPARLSAQRETGGHVEVLLVERLSAKRWHAMVRCSKTLRLGETLTLGGARWGDAAGQLRIVSEVREGRAEVEFLAADAVERFGEPPLPPYIRRLAKEVDRERYQTVYAREDGSIAAPTAGLHFTPEIFAALAQRGVTCQSVTLHVGPGTFSPVRCQRLSEHRMEAERYHVPAATAAAIQLAHAQQRRVVAVGTTVVRAVETTGGAAGQGRTDLFIYPGRAFRVVDVLLSNFHLPRSTLLALVCAFAGRETVLEAYRHAVHERYRFYSYGDAMLIL